MVGGSEGFEILPVEEGKPLPSLEESQLAQLGLSFCLKRTDHQKDMWEAYRWAVGLGILPCAYRQSFNQILSRGFQEFDPNIINRICARFCARPLYIQILVDRII